VIEENGLNRIIDTYHETEGVLSIQPYHRVRRLYEEFSAFFNLVMMAAMGTFTILGTLIKPIGLFGPVMVLTKERYVESGGHEQVKGEILEDLAYGSQVKKQRIGTYCFGGKNTVSFRMYSHGMRQLIAGWSKGFARGATKTSIPVLIMIVAWITGSIGTTRHLIQTALIPDLSQLMLWALLYFAYAIQIYWMLFRMGNFKFYTALLYPVPLLFFVVIFAYSLILTFLGKSVRWKGREIGMKDKKEA
jgi:4,4'-diaponeurosporenoate glycosyltransferase